MRFQSNFTLKFLLTELWRLSFRTKLFLYLNSKITMKVSYGKNNTINHAYSVRRWYECLKALFFKSFLFEFCCLLVRWNSCLSCDCANTYILIMSFLFLSCFFESVFIYFPLWRNFTATFLINERLQKVNMAIFLNWVLVWCFQVILYFLYCGKRYICSRFVFKLMISFIMLQLNNTL